MDFFLSYAAVFVVGGILARLKQGEKRSVFQSIESRVRGVLTPYLSFSLMLLTMNTITHLLNSEALSGAALARQYVDTFDRLRCAYFMVFTGLFYRRHAVRGADGNL